MHTIECATAPIDFDLFDGFPAGECRKQSCQTQDMIEMPVGTPIVLLGGPAMLIGLGGGAASSMASGESAENLDFASVQRGNPEMERRCQEVIDRCWSANP